MKFRFLILFFVFLCPGLLLAEIELDKLMENANQKKTPAGVVVKIQPGESRKEPVKTTQETTRFSTRSGLAQDPNLIFAAGAYLTFSDRFYFLNATGKNLTSVFQTVREILQGLSLSEKTIQNYDQFTQCLLSLPFGTAWEMWSAEQQNNWNQNGCPGWRDLMFNQISPQIKDNPETYFFFWLGVDSARLGGSIPQYLRDGKTLSEVSKDLQDSIYGFYYAQNDKYLSMLTPEIASAVSQIAAMKAKLDKSGIGSITLDDVDKMRELAGVIIGANSNETLIRK